MANACSSSSSEQEGDSIFDFPSSCGFSSSSSHSCEGDSGSGRGKPATLIRNWASNQSSERAKGRVKTLCGNSFIQQP